MAKLIALCCIKHNFARVFEETGYVDADGALILRARSETINPGEPFEIDDEAEAEWLISVNAARAPSDTEGLLLARSGAGPGATE